MIVTVTLNASLDKTYSAPGLALGSDLVAERVVPSPGGKGLNVASFAQMLGAPVLTTGIVGGHTGHYILDLLATRNIPADFVVGPGESRSCHIIHDPVAGTLTQIREPGPTVDKWGPDGPEAEGSGTSPGTSGSGTNGLGTLNPWTGESGDSLSTARFRRSLRCAVVDKVRELAVKSRIVVFSGSVPAGLGTDVYRELVGVAKEAGARTVLDASGEPLELGLEAGPYLIKPNEAELAELAQRLGLGFDAPSNADQVRQWAATVARHVHQQYGIAVIVASLGPLGAIVVAAGDVYSAIPPAITPINTISCGDALVAGIVVGWQRGLSLAESVRLGIATSAAKALQFETGYFDVTDVDSLLTRVRWSAREKG